MKLGSLIGLLTGFLTLAVPATQALAQKTVIRPCPGTSGAECVEFTVRYHLKEQKGYPGVYSGSKKIQLLSGDPSKPASMAAAGPGCEISDKPTCQVSTDKVNVIDLSGLRLLQGKKNPTCYLICNGGWCWEACY